MFSLTDTIVAIATPPGRGGIGVVRLSGADAQAVAQRVIDRTTPLEARHATLTKVRLNVSAVVSGSGRTTQADVLAERAEDGKRAIEHRLIAAHHHRQRASVRSGGPAGYGRVEEVRASRPRCLGAATALSDADGGMVRVDLSGAGALEHLSVDLLHRLRRRKRREHDVGALRHFTRRRCRSRAFSRERLDWRTRAVERMDLEPGGKHPLSHRRRLPAGGCR